MAGLMDFFGMLQNPEQADIRKIDNQLAAAQMPIAQEPMQAQPAMPQQEAPQGFMDQLSGFMNDPEKMGRLALGLNTMRLTPDQGLATVLSEQIKDARARKAANASLQYLTNIDPQLADLVRQGVLTPKDALSVAHQNKASYGLTPIEIVDGQGNKRLIQVNNMGGMKELALPEGFKVSPKVDKVDLGTAWMLMDKSGNPIGTVQKDLAGMARAGVTGKAEGENIVAAPSVISGYQRQINLIDKFMKMPGFDDAFGLYASKVPTLRQDTANVEEMLGQIKGGAFLTAIDALRGMGSLSNAEGDAARQAITSISLRQDPAMARAVLSDLREIMRQGIERAKNSTKIDANYVPDYLKSQGLIEGYQQPEQQQSGTPSGSIYNNGNAKTVGKNIIVEIPRQ